MVFLENGQKIQKIGLSADIDSGALLYRYGPKYPRVDVYGSISEIEHDFNVEVEDLHRPFIDSLTRSNPDDPSGKSTMRRVPGVFDCWFESGSMPYAKEHYPFENQEKIEKILQILLQNIKLKQGVGFIL